MIAELLVNALISGLLLGGFYAAISIGLSISFGLLDTVNIAHPTFLVLGAFLAYILNSQAGIDPLLAGVLMTPIFFILGLFVYSIYYQFFEKNSAEALRGLAFFLGMELSVPYRMLSVFIVASIMTVGLHLFFSRTFFGRASRAVHQDMLALSLMGVDPIRVKRIAFAIALATCGVGGALMIIMIPIEPAVGRLYIGNVFAIVVLGGLGSISGTLIAAVLLGVAESVVATFLGPSWSPAVSFGILLAVLAFKPSGMFGVGDTR
jgi:branched-chain amino acid transport system permease protein